MALWFTDTIKRKQPYGFDCEDEEDDNAGADTNCANGGTAKSSGQPDGAVAAGKDVEIGLTQRGGRGQLHSSDGGKGIAEGQNALVTH